MAAYRHALQLDPTLGKAEVNLGTLLARQGRLEEARSHLERGVTLDPQSAVGQVNLGQLHQLEGRAEESLSAYKRALAIDRSHLSARESAAYLLYGLGRRIQARAQLDSVSGSGPGRLCPVTTGLGPATASGGADRRGRTGLGRVPLSAGGGLEPGPGGRLRRGTQLPQGRGEGAAADEARRMLARLEQMRSGGHP